MTMTNSTNKFDPTQHSHRRYNPLLGQWVLCSPHRALRPWQGGVEPNNGSDKKVRYDSECYLCPKNRRVKGEVTNPDYEGAFTFTNDFPAMQMEGGEEEEKEGDSEEGEEKEGDSEEGESILKLKRVRGTSKVICYTPHHDLTLATLPPEEVYLVVKEWQRLYLEFKLNQPTLNYLQIFENKGQAMGCSNPHPHGQVWVSDQIPSLPKLELEQLNKYNKHKERKDKNVGKNKKKKVGKKVEGEVIVEEKEKEKEDGTSCCLLCDYSKLELSTSHQPNTRIIDISLHFIALVPYWATWPYEILILSKSHLPHIGIMDDPILLDLANLVNLITIRYDNLFQCDFPYSMGIHQAPLHNSSPHYDEIKLSHFHLHFYPPLLRSATIKKWMVGFEMLGEPQRDLTPEQAAYKLRSLPTQHYTKNPTTTTTTLPSPTSSKL